MTFFDIHGQCYLERCVPLEDGTRQFPDADGLLAAYDRAGISRGALLPLANPEGVLQSQSNEEVLEIVRRHPDRFVAFCNVDPRNMLNSRLSDFAGALETYRARGCRGLGDVAPALRVTDERVQALFRAAEEVGLPVIFRLAPFVGATGGLADLPGLPSLAETLARFPKLRMIGHGTAFWAELGAYAGQDARFRVLGGPVEEGALPKLLRTYPNLSCDLAGAAGANALRRDRAYAAKFLAEFRDRVFFGLGSGAPALAPFLNDLREKGDISAEVFEMVTHGNAERIVS